MQSAAFNPNLVGELASWMEGSDPQGPTPEVRPGTEHDAVDGIVPSLVARPGSAKQVSAAVRFAGTHGLSIVPGGGRTHQTWGGVLERADVLLDLSAMDRVVEYQPADMTITVQAGCPVAKLQEMLSRNRQFLPVDPPLHPGATVGGLVATNAAGPLRLAYGTGRDYLLGIRLVQANGDVVSVGGRVVKNAAGYELTKLFTGSLGTLGVMVECTFMVRPMPEEQQMLFIPIPSIDAAEPVIATLLDTTLEPTLLELANQAALGRFPAGAVPEAATSFPYALLLGFMGSSTAVRWQVGYVQDLLASLPAPSGEKLEGRVVPWDHTYEGLMNVRCAEPDGLVCRATLLSSEVASFFQRAESLFRAHGLQVPMVAHAGTGIVHAYIDPHGTDYAEVMHDLLRMAGEVSDVVPAPSQASYQNIHGAASGPSVLELPGVGDLASLRSLYAGNVVVESAPASVRRALPVWGNKPAHHELGAELRRKLDPQGLLNPGRMLGG